MFTSAAVLTHLILMANASLVFSEVGISPSPSSFELAESTAKARQCGIIATYAIAKRYSAPVTLEAVMNECPSGTVEKGMRVDVLRSLLASHGLQSQVIKGNQAQVVAPALAQGYTAVIPCTRNKHFYVFFAADDDGRILCLDPPAKASWVSKEHAASCFENVAIVVSPKSWMPFNPPDPGHTQAICLCIAGGGLTLLGGLLLLWRRMRLGRPRPIAAVLLLATLTQVGAKAWAVEPTQDSSSPATVESFSHNLGIVKPGQTYTHVFAITNSFGANLKITRTLTGCTCTEVKLDSHEAGPDKVLTAEMGLRVKADQICAIEATATLLGESGGLPVRLELALTGTTEEANGRLVASVPFIDLDGACADDMVHRSIYISRADNASVLIGSTQVSNSAIIVTPAKVIVPRNNGGRYFLNVDIDLPKLKTNTVNEWIRVRPKTSQPADLLIPVRGRLADSVNAIPKRLFLDKFSEPRTWSFNLVGPPGEQLSIERARHTLGNGWLLAATGTQVRLRMTSTPPAMPGPIEGHIQVELLAGSPRRRVPVSIPVVGAYVPASEQAASSRPSPGPDSAPPAEICALETLDMRLAVTNLYMCDPHLVVAKFIVQSASDQQAKSFGSVGFDETTNCRPWPLAVEDDSTRKREWWAFTRVDVEDSFGISLKIRALSGLESRASRSTANLPVSEFVFLSLPLESCRHVSLEETVAEIYSEALAAEQAGRFANLVLKRKELPDHRYESRQCKPSMTTQDDWTAETKSRLPAPAATQPASTSLAIPDSHPS